MKYTFSAITLAATLGLATAIAVEPRQSASFVKTKGQQFTLDGQKFTVVGSNSYWMAQLSNTADITTAFNDLKKAGLTTLRTWGFNEVTSPSGTYYQIWNGKTPTLNTGADGLGKFDIVVAQAKAAGIRLIVPLTNNWADYGGMDVYVKQLLGSDNHDLFYTDTTVKNAFKKYISGFVGRYKNEPTIMAWELANEPRCKGSTGTSTGTCNAKTITEWATDISAYIKSIAPNHLVAIGDEGFYNRPGAPTYPYQGGEGIDFDANLKIPSIDFGTAHSYPEHWGQESNITAWGTQWIIDHAASQKAANKPVILEEFGVTSSHNPSTTYTTWWDAIISSGLAGDLIWQAGSTVSTGKTHDDGFTVYPDEPEYALQTKYAAALKARK
ncbi:putative mannan endo-1,4-beta-mannosidase A OS=Neosartorya fischeri (strain ATCC 1020 / DSM 3700 / FGSC A1164 / NRRL 181) GN=manA PE=3 SV=1 [Rhizoctonia solani AG-1 IB]|uniref:mannan endo-1,4-beta-mannosidase n=1 Tax=Thanatephorus cucumeris (strain AG1-IB / isolate 7/3/14) TaxID=1108050 RepID=A0A0B7FT22_THACB|nr:putative mannan endo-1,4-beta-mannosidase A OS=Neosartorya fischeri (strain ATCC 1020 / DSM 3700 / FGSC A1164 / NRRL 181) GN=manA PE=3 SV=1 [Rhizoctonia solani AG-1 IB]